MTMTRNFLIFLHRYLGIALSLLFIIWFASGFALIYTGGMPYLTERERLQSLPAIDFQNVSITPAEAQRISRANSTPKLTTVMARPAYQFITGAGRIVFADDGTLLTDSMISSRQIIADFIGSSDVEIERIGRIEEVDQWTIGLRAELPLEKFRVNDGLGTEIYVSPRWGQVILETSNSERFLAWIGAIPHWLYFVDLRRNAALWNDTVVWLSTLGIGLVMIGIILIFTQLRPTKPFSMSKAIPYRGVMRWHYLTGLFFGVITLSWVFSGLLSMDPYEWNRTQGISLSPAMLDDGEFTISGFNPIVEENTQQEILNMLQDLDVKEIEFEYIQGEYYIHVVAKDEESSWGYSRRLYGLATLQFREEFFSAESVLDQIQSNVESTVLSAAVLEQYDNYYYSRPSFHGPSLPLPVLRINFDDPMETSAYIDLRSNELVYVSHRWGRVERWLYRGLHSLDFGSFYRSRPLWDAVIIVLLCGGLVLVTIGTYIGFRRLYWNSKRVFSLRE